MIIYVKGDLLESDCTVIAHGCNCFHTMGSGIAKSISDRWPEVYVADCRDSAWGTRDKLGTFTSCQVHGNGPLVYNLYTQFRYGRDKMHTEYEAVEHSLRAVRRDLLVRGTLSTCKFGTYRLGCNRGGADWSIVSNIIDSVFRDIDVYIYDKEDAEELTVLKQRLSEHWQTLHSESV
jgi:O-acetyl-ADP-ribose deacetylase (regulator of RNase III)